MRRACCFIILIVALAWSLPAFADGNTNELERRIDILSEEVDLLKESGPSASFWALGLCVVGRVRTHTSENLSHQILTLFSPPTEGSNPSPPEHIVFSSSYAGTKWPAHTPHAQTRSDDLDSRRELLAI